MGLTLQIPSQLSSHLRAWRKARGLSQAALGKRLGLSQARMARIEGDPLSVSVEQLLAVLTALEVRVTLDASPPQPAVVQAVRKTPAARAAARKQEADW
jgi:HTH-type transcriptional regulator/antitoxin HipB